MSKLWPAIWIALGLALLVRTGERDRGVITDHIEFGRRLVAGEDLYAPYLEPKPLHPVYPPSFGLMTWPFSIVPERAARYAWGIVQVIALLYLGRRLAAWVRADHPALVPRTHAILALVALASSRYVLRDTHGGGGNLINVALVLGAFHAAGLGRAALGGALLGLSLATKPTTALLVPLLWIIGHRRAAGVSLLTAALLVTAALVVNGRGIEPFAQWVRGSVAYAGAADVFAPPAQGSPAEGFPPFSWMNQCLRCAFARYLGEVPGPLAAEVPGFFQGLGWSPTAVSWIARVASIAILGATFGIAWARRRAAPASGVLLATVLAASLLVSPISWKAHHVALIPALFLLVVTMLSGSRAALAGFVVYLLACVLGGGDLVGRAVQTLQESLYLATLGTIGLWAFCLSVARRRDGSLSGPAAVR